MYADGGTRIGVVPLRPSAGPMVRQDRAWSRKQSVTHLDFGPIAVQRLGLVEYGLRGVIQPACLATAIATARARRRSIGVFAKESLGLGSARKLAARLLGPSTDALPP